MAGLRDTIELDIDAALASVHSLENALDQAARGFRVELARSLDVLRDLDAPDVDVAVRVDTAQAQAEMEQLSLLDADVGVRMVVTGEADVEAADDAVEELGDEAKRTGDEAEKMGSRFGAAGASIKQALAVVGVAGLVKGITAAGDAASDLAENQSKANVVFGESVGAVNDFVADSATAVGLSKQAALGFAGTFGNLFVALKLSQDQAADLSTGIVSLGADLASFNNLEVDEVLEKLRSGLVGEAEPLRSLGVNITAATTEAKALELGLAGVASELTEADKVQARYALIMEQTAVAQGDFARTSDGLANQQRIMKAELADAAAVIGTELLPILLEFVHGARDDLIPALTALATSAIPAFAAGMHAAVPIGLSFVDILVALTPLITIFGEVLSAIPTPLLTVLTAVAGLSRGLGPLPGAFSGVSKAIKEAGETAMKAGGQGLSAGQKLSAGIGAINPTLLIGTVAVGVFAAAWSDYQAEQAEARKAVEDATKAFVDQAGAISTSTEALTQSRIVGKNQEDDIKRLGLSVKQFDDLARGSDQGILDFLDAAERVGEVEFVDPSSLKGVFTAGQSLQFLGKQIQGNTGLVDSLRDLRESYQEGAEKAVDLALATEAVTKAQYDAAISANTAEDGSVNYLGALEALERQQARTAEAERIAAVNRAAAFDASFTGKVSAATEALAAYEGKQSAVAASGGLAADKMQALVEQFRQGEISAGQLALMADATGLSFETLFAIQSEVIESTAAFSKSVVDGLTSVTDAIGDLKHDDSLDSFLANLKQKGADTALFLARINDLIARGADDLAADLLTAGVDNAATALADASKLGDRALADRERQVEEAEALDARNVASAQQAAIDLVGSQGGMLEDLANLPPPDLTGPFSEEAVNLAIRAEQLRTDLPPIVRSGAEQAGLEFGAGIEAGAFGAHEQIATAGADAAGHLDDNTGARAAGEAVGGDFMDGILLGIYAKTPAVEGGATALAGKLSGPLRDALGSASPSKVAMAIGRDFVEGMTIGLSDTAGVEAQARAVAAAVSETVAAIAPQALSLEVDIGTSIVEGAEAMLAAINAGADELRDALTGEVLTDTIDLIGRRRTDAGFGEDPTHGAEDARVLAEALAGDLAPLTNRIQSMFEHREVPMTPERLARIVGEVVAGRTQDDVRWSLRDQVGPVVDPEAARRLMEVQVRALEDSDRASIAARDAAAALAAIAPAFTAASVAPPPVVVGASAGAGLGGAGGIVVNGPIFDGLTIDQGVDPMHVFAEARNQLVEVSVPAQ